VSPNFSETNLAHSLNSGTLVVISGFRQDVNETFALLWCYIA